MVLPVHTIHIWSLQVVLHKCEHIDTKAESGVRRNIRMKVDSIVGLSSSSSNIFQALNYLMTYVWNCQTMCTPDPNG